MICAMSCGVRCSDEASDIATVEASDLDRTRGIQNYNAPPEVTFAKADASPGTVTFRHWSHADAERPNCTVCHSEMFKMMKPAHMNKAATDMHATDKCGACHDGKIVIANKHVFDLKDTRNCTKCHNSE